MQAKFPRSNASSQCSAQKELLCVSIWSRAKVVVQSSLEYGRRQDSSAVILELNRSHAGVGVGGRR